MIPNLNTHDIVISILHAQGFSGVKIYQNEFGYQINGDYGSSWVEVEGDTLENALSNFQTRLVEITESNFKFNLKKTFDI